MSVSHLDYPKMSTIQSFYLMFYLLAHLSLYELVIHPVSLSYKYEVMHRPNTCSYHST